MNVGEEGDAHALFGADFLVFAFKREMEVIHIEQVTRLTEGA